MTIRSILVMLALGAGFLGEPLLTASQNAAAVSPQAATPGAVNAENALIGTYCVSCHNERLKTGNLVLEKVDIVDASPAAAALREKVIRKVRSGVMPPVSAPRPDAAVLKNFVSELETMNNRAAEAAPNPGRPLVHRLNRAEYTNAV